ncbi:MAG TPA: serine/threonine-protein kinase [Gemmatimonadales bacterium]|nr:serine/threonine-protein kinase [Gemmatimonadales bacterium]
MLELLRRSTIGEYDVLGELGRGGMATVYLAHDIALDRKVAIKIMNPQILLGPGMIDRFKREARTAGSLSHPHIIPIYLVREAGQILFFIMKYVEGRSLDSIIKEQGALPVKMVQAILVQVGGALGYAHRRGVVHRDIKPANIMIDDEGWAVVTDFGIAKVAEASGLTQSGATVGTPVYMSPEQASARDITGASDQYSLGVVAYEMLTGKPPFGGDSILAIMRGHLFDPLPPVTATRPDCPPVLAAAISRMLEKEPERRWGSLEEAATAVGTAPMAMDDPVRTRMIELARSGTKVRRISLPATPRSPIPVGRTEAAIVTRHRTNGARRSPIVTVGGAVVVLLGGVWLARARPWDRGAPPSSGIPVESLAAVHRRDSAAAVDRQKQTAARAETTPAGVRLNDSLTLALGQTRLIPVSVFSRSGVMLPDSEPVWRSRSPSVVRVDSTGRAVGLRPGVAIVEARVDSFVAHTRIRVLAPSTLGVVPAPAAVAQTESNPPSPAVPGVVKLGTRGLPAVLSIDGEPQGAAGSLKSWSARPGSHRVTISEAGCKDWDTTVTVAPGGIVSIGYRSPTCPSH